MSKLVFRNRNTKAIKKILMEIGHKKHYGQTVAHSKSLLDS